MADSKENYKLDLGSKRVWGKIKAVRLSQSNQQIVLATLVKHEPGNEPRGQRTFGK